MSYLNTLLHQLVPFALYTSLGLHVSLWQFVHIHPFEKFVKTEVSEYIDSIGKL